MSGIACRHGRPRLTPVSPLKVTRLGGTLTAGLTGDQLVRAPGILIEHVNRIATVTRRVLRPKILHEVPAQHLVFGLRPGQGAPNRRQLLQSLLGLGLGLGDFLAPRHNLLPRLYFLIVQPLNKLSDTHLLKP
jgi:hypothetical protein